MGCYAKRAPDDALAVAHIRKVGLTFATLVVAGRMLLCRPWLAQAVTCRMAAIRNVVVREQNVMVTVEPIPA
jgi:hypothetical protein